MRPVNVPLNRTASGRVGYRRAPRLSRLIAHAALGTATAMLATMTFAPSAAAQTKCDPPPGSVVLFEEPNYTGNCAVFRMGEYADVTRSGLRDNAVSSIKVGAGVVAVVHQDVNFGGLNNNSWESFTASVPNLAGYFYHQLQSPPDNLGSVDESISALWVMRTGCVPGAYEIALYDETDLTGACALVPAGEYSAITQVGVPNDFVGSVRLGPNVSAVLWQHGNFGGIRCDLTPGLSEVACFGDNVASSLSVAVVGLGTTSVSPNQVTAPPPDAPSPSPVLITVTGNGFDAPSATVHWNESPLTTISASESVITAEVPPALVASPTGAMVTVVNEVASTQSNPQPVFVTSEDVAIIQPQTKITDDASVPVSAVSGAVSAEASGGTGALTVARYDDTPSTLPLPLPSTSPGGDPSSPPSYFDVMVSHDATFQQATVSTSDLAPGENVLFWENPSWGWEPVSHQVYDPTTRSVSSHLTESSSPSLTHLNGTVFVALDGYAAGCGLLAATETRRGLIQSLCNAFERAKREEAKGKPAQKQKALDDIVTTVTRENGKALTATEATLLLRLVDALR